MATWMVDKHHDYGKVLNSVLTTGEGAGFGGTVPVDCHALPESWGTIATNPLFSQSLL